NVTAASGTTKPVNQAVTPRIGTSGSNSHLNVIRLLRVMAIVDRDDRILRWGWMARCVHFRVRRGQAVFRRKRQKSAGGQILADTVGTCVAVSETTGVKN